jgi:hypothetical protein
MVPKMCGGHPKFLVKLKTLLNQEDRFYSSSIIYMFDDADGGKWIPSITPITAKLLTLRTKAKKKTF